MSGNFTPIEKRVLIRDTFNSIIDTSNLWPIFNEWKFYTYKLGTNYTYDIIAKQDLLKEL